MNKRFLILLIFTLTFLSGCEKDDICLEPTTSKLIVRFYDATNPTETKKVTHFSIWAEGKDTISNYKNVATDSIVIPLNVNNTQTVYHLKMNANTGNIVDIQTVEQAKGKAIDQLAQVLKQRGVEKGELTEFEKKNGRSVTIMGDKDVPYLILKGVMATCSQENFRDIALAVNQVVGSALTSGGQP